MRALWLAFCLVCPTFLLAQDIPPIKSDSIVSFSSNNNTVEFRTRKGTLRVIVCTDGMVHLLFDPGTHVSHPQPWILQKDWAATPFTVTEDAKKNIVIATKRLRIIAHRDSASLTFEDAQGDVLLRESPSPRPRQITPVTLDGEKTFHADAYFDLTEGEALYGLGQHQSGLLNLRGTDLLLLQDNTNITIPFLLSSRGYGLLWNSASLGRMENHYQPKLALHANVADAVDYYFLYGPDFDRIIGAYRRLTGEAPMLPLWAYGFWQSRLQYETQEEMLAVAAKYRALKIPLDNLVLDFFWMQRMGSHQFTSKFPDPAAMFRQLADIHVHTMLSIWPFYMPPSANFDEMAKNGFFVTGGRTELPTFFPGSRLFDAFNPDGRKLFWQQIKAPLFDKGVSAWWLDSSEPLDFFGEEQGALLEGAHTALGSGSRYANMYPLFETKAVYDGQRAATDKQRVFILTRSAFLGQQANAAVSWSGDIAPTFDSLRRQIPAGLNFSMSGLPYWTTDIGGFLGGDPKDPAYQEIFVRWFEYGAFCPIFRTHGARPANELWSYGPQAQQILVYYDKLRYRLLPYIYSLAWKTTSEGYTPMRALVMDFRADRKAFDIADEFMFGPALLVNPVTNAGATSRDVYLPLGTTWYDFWTGEPQRGGETINAASPLETMPIYVRAGSVIPMGPEVQHAGEVPWAPLEVRVYPGADGNFTLYEDDGQTYAYEKGGRATITFTWSDDSRTLLISAYTGPNPTMQPTREFHIVVVGKGHGIGEQEAAPNMTISYHGAAATAKFSLPAN